MIGGRIHLSQNGFQENATGATHIRINAIINHSPSDADYQFQFNDGADCAGNPIGSPVDVSEDYMNY